MSTDAIPHQTKTVERKPETIIKRILNVNRLRAEIDDIIRQLAPNSGYVRADFAESFNNYIVNVYTKHGETQNKFDVPMINMITLALAQRLDVNTKDIKLVVDKIEENSINPTVMAERMKEMIESGYTERRAANTCLKIIMRSNANPLGAEIKVSGKLKGQRARSKIFREGKMLHTGDFVKSIVSSDVRHCYLKVGVIGIKVKIHAINPKETQVPNHIKINEGKPKNLANEESHPPEYHLDAKKFPEGLKVYLKKKLPDQQPSLDPIQTMEK
ncbi:MAG: 40S ribosomal protein S3 [Paramarteilia canceri]